MNRLGKVEISELLASRSHGKAPDAEAFWSDFKARAQLVNQDQPVVNPGFSLSMKVWVAATACVALLAAFGIWSLVQPTSGGEDTGQMTLDVVAAHSAVLMIEDEQTHGTIVWLVGMDGDDNGDKS